MAEFVEDVMAVVCEGVVQMDGVKVLDVFDVVEGWGVCIVLGRW